MQDGQAGAAYRLSTDVVIDAVQIGELVRLAKQELVAGEFDSAVSTATSAVDLWRGEPALEVPLWLGLYREAHEVRAEALVAGGYLDRAAELIEESLHHFPTDERCWGLLMRALYANGKQRQAVAAYDRAAKALDQQLAVRPGTELRSLLHRIETDDANLRPASRPPTPAVRAPADAARSPGDDGRLMVAPSLVDGIEPARTWPRSGPRRSVRMVALTTVVALVALIAWRQARGPAADQAPSPTGRIAYQREGTLEPGIYVMDPDGTNAVRMPGTTAEDRFPAWSPDGARIAFRSNRDGKNQIYIVRADGSGLVRITNTSTQDSNPAWSPDGRRIAFTSNRGQGDEIYVMGADGSDPKRLSRSASKDLAPAWSPDGQRIAFTSERDGDREVYVMSVDGSGQVRLTYSQGDDSFPHWSPDGQQIAFTSNRDGNDEIYLMAADGSHQRALTNGDAGDFGAVWSPDGKQLAFQSNGTGVNQIYAMRTDGSHQVQLTTGAPSTFPSWGPSASSR